MVRLLLFILAIVADDLSDIFGGEVFVGRVEEMRDVFVGLDADGAAYPLHELGGAEAVEGYDVSVVGLLCCRLFCGVVLWFSVDVVAVVLVGGYVKVFEEEVSFAVGECGTEPFFPVVLAVGGEEVFVALTGFGVDPGKPHGYFGEYLAFGVVVTAYGVVLSGVFDVGDFLFEKESETVHVFADDGQEFGAGDVLVLSAGLVFSEAAYGLLELVEFGVDGHNWKILSSVKSDCTGWNSPAVSSHRSVVMVMPERSMWSLPS